MRRRIDHIGDLCILRSPRADGLSNPASTSRGAYTVGRMTSREYDLIVIGAGPVGQNIADRAKQGGLSVVVV